MFNFLSRVDFVTGDFSFTLLTFLTILVNSISVLFFTVSISVELAYIYFIIFYKLTP
jgi:hypothetical protein